MPSARNSGFDKTSNVLPVSAVSKTSRTRSAERTGKVDFSTTSVWSRADFAIWRVQASTKRRSDALPAPSPSVLVGVFTAIKIQSAFAIALSISVEKWRLRPRARFTTASRPGSKTGSGPLFHAAIRSALASTTVTWICGQRSAITAMVGPPT